MYTVEQSLYGRKEGQPVTQYTLRNRAGVSCNIIDYGATITKWKLPVANGEEVDIVLGYDTLEAYLAGDASMGCMVGRYCNRIAGASFKIGDKEYHVTKNNGENCLHGGHQGLNRQIWKTSIVHNTNGPSIKMMTALSDGLDGFPGTLQVEHTITLGNDNKLSLVTRATTDQDTVVNLTNHSYFNLAGHDAGQLSTHQLTIDADTYLDTDQQSIPRGSFALVEDTPFDFRVAKNILKDINTPHDQLAYGSGYDHTFVLNKPYGEFAKVAEVKEVQTGRRLKVWTTEPGIQLYTGNHLSSDPVGKMNTSYSPRAGFCLETQHYPDAPNQAHFPSTLLRVGEVYESRTVYELNFQH